MWTVNVGCSWMWSSVYALQVMDGWFVTWWTQYEHRVGFDGCVDLLFSFAWLKARPALLGDILAAVHDGICCRWRCAQLLRPGSHTEAGWKQLIKMFIKQFSVASAAIHLPLPPPAKTHRRTSTVLLQQRQCVHTLTHTQAWWVISAAFKADLYSVVVKLLESQTLLTPTVNK